MLLIYFKCILLHLHKLCIDYTRNNHKLCLALHNLVFFQKKKLLPIGHILWWGIKCFLWKRCRPPPPLYSPFRLCLEIYIEKNMKNGKMLWNFPRKIWIKKISNYKTNCSAHKLGWFLRYRKYKLFWFFLHLILINHLFELVKDSFAAHSRLALNHYFG